MGRVTELEVRLYGTAIGVLTRLPDDRNIFAFNQHYIDDPTRPTLSLSFKNRHGELITQNRPTRTRLSPFFANLLPEGHMRNYLAARAQELPQREFFLLWALGRDLPGALTVYPSQPDTLPPESSEDSSSGERNNRSTALQFSLAGVQIKFSAIRAANGSLTIPIHGAGGSWIAKLPSVAQPEIAENEYSMMELARRTGIDVPECAIVAVSNIADIPDAMGVAGANAFIIKRFDRAINGERVHSEDFAQIFGVYPADKYKQASYESLARVVLAETGETGIREYVRRLVFNALIGNGDMHLKNWSVIYPDKRNAALAPAYDFVSTIPYIHSDRLALNLAGSKEFSSLSDKQFERFASKADLPVSVVLETVKATVQNFAAVWSEARDLPLTHQVKHTIDQHLKTIPIWTSHR
jgi:serine/threonine-protein kinase HipA